MYSAPTIICVHTPILYDNSEERPSSCQFALKAYTYSLITHKIVAMGTETFRGKFMLHCLVSEWQSFVLSAKHFLCAYTRGGQPFLFFTLNLDAPHQASISFQFFKTSASNIDEKQIKSLHFTPSDSGAPRIWQRGATTGGLGVKPPAANEFLRFSYKKKNTHFSTLFLSKKGMQ